MANCLFALDRVPEAVKLYEELRKAKPDDPELCLRIARMHLQAGNHEAALKAATDGLVTKGASGIRGDLAQVVFEILNKAQKHPEMYAAFKAWSTAHPNDPQAYLWMGYTRFLEKNLDEAISLYQKGFDVSGKKHAGLALELGNAYAEKSNGLAKDEHEKTVMKAAEAYGAALKAQAEWPRLRGRPDLEAPRPLGIVRDEGRPREGHRGPREVRPPRGRRRLEREQQPRSLLSRLGGPDRPVAQELGRPRQEREVARVLPEGDEGGARRARPRRRRTRRRC